VLSIVFAVIHLCLQEMNAEASEAANYCSKFSLLYLYRCRHYSFCIAMVWMSAKFGAIVPGRTVGRVIQSSHTHTNTHTHDLQLPICLAIYTPQRNGQSQIYCVIAILSNPRGPVMNL